MNADTISRSSNMLALAGWLALLASPFVPRLRRPHRRPRHPGAAGGRLYRPGACLLVLGAGRVRQPRQCRRAFRDARAAAGRLDPLPRLRPVRRRLDRAHRTAGRDAVLAGRALPRADLPVRTGRASSPFVAIRAARNPSPRRHDGLRPSRRISMSAIAIELAQPDRLAALRPARRRCDAPSRASSRSAMLMLAAMAPTAFAALVDPRTFLGIDVWIKPFKFEFALAVYFVDARLLRPLPAERHDGQALVSPIQRRRGRRDRRRDDLDRRRCDARHRLAFQPARRSASSSIRLMGVGAVLLTSASCGLRLPDRAQSGRPACRRR